MMAEQSGERRVTAELISLMVPDMDHELVQLILSRVAPSAAGGPTDHQGHRGGSKPQEYTELLAFIRAVGIDRAQLHAILELNMERQHVKDINDLMGRLETASTIGEILESGWDAFELIQRSADIYARPLSSSYPTWMAVIAPACEGRDALASAPSMPPGLVTGHLKSASAGEEEAARLIAALARLLSTRMQEPALPGAAPGDTQARIQAAHAAEEIHQLLSLDEP
jgi:hypothetical protein